MSDDKKGLAVTIFVIVSLIWGSSFILIKKGLQYFPPEQVGALRMLFAFILLGGVGIAIARKIPKEKWKFIAISGTAGNLIPAFLFPLAQTQIASSVTGILNALTPLFTLIIGMAIFRFQVRASQVAGLALGFVGSVSLTFVNNNGSFGSINYYALFIVAATVLYGINTNVIKIHLSSLPSLYVGSAVYLLIGPVVLVYLFGFTDFWYTVNHTPGAWGALGYLAVLGFFGSAIGLVLYNRLVQITSVVFSSATTYAIPVVSVIWGILDGERIFLLHYLGMAFIIGGIYLINRAK